ncbi:unnamed protein product [Heterotrigona itama]|uniref:Uncharacterized protein n=1 Tax=Heterotrigona itama TaxID=395501 RepID=A0A6V7HAG8_9HYME|nr:unnamed protein product [Heterotrigona itama]
MDERKEQISLNWLRGTLYNQGEPISERFEATSSLHKTSIGAEYLVDKEHLYLGDALGNDVIRERRELLLQLMEQLHDSDVRAMALPHRGPPSSWQGLPVGASLVDKRFGWPPNTTFRAVSCRCAKVFQIIQPRMSGRGCD